MSSSGGAPSANTSSSPAVIAGQGALLLPLFLAPTATTRHPILRLPRLPWRRIWMACGRRPAVANTLLESYQDLLAKHQQAMRDLIAARRHNEDLLAQGRPNWETVRAFVDFAQHRYDVSQGRLRQAIQREAETVRENEQLRIEVQGFSDLRARHALAEEVASEAYTRLQDYPIGLEQRLASSQDPQSSDPSPLTQDLQDVREENAQFKQQSVDLERRLQRAISDRDVALQDLFRLQKDHAGLKKDHAELRRRYEQWKAYGEGRDQEIRDLREDLAKSVPAADLHASRIEVHVRGQKIAELEKFLAKSESRRQNPHQVHDRVADRLKAADQKILDLKSQLNSSFRHHAHADDVLQDVENKLRALKADHAKLSEDKAAVAAELMKNKSQLADLTGELRASQTDCHALDSQLEQVVQDRQQLRRRISQAEAEIANIGRIRQDRDAAEAQVKQLNAELVQADDDREFAVRNLARVTRGQDRIVLESQQGLLSQISDIQRAYQLVRLDHDQLQDRHDKLQKDHRDLLADHHLVAGERDSAFDRLSSLASAALREASTARGERSASATRRSGTRFLSPSPPSRQSDQNRLRKIPRSSSPAPSAASGSGSGKTGGPIPSRSDLFANLPADAEDEDYQSESSECSSDAGSADSDPVHDQAGSLQGSSIGSAVVSSPAGSVAAPNDAEPDASHGVVDRETAKSAASSGSEVASGDPESSSDESEDDQVRMALARSRADARRRGSSGDAPTGSGSVTAPIELDQEAAQEEDDDDVDESEAEVEHPTASTRSGSTFQPYGPVENFVPGFHQSRRVAEGAVAPWDPKAISALTLDTVTPRILTERKVLTAGWLFPKRTGHVGQLDPALYDPRLITEDNAEALYDGKPWEALYLSSVEPLTFDSAGSPHLVKIVSNFQIFVSDHRQAIWESTHSFPISKARQKAEEWATKFYFKRKNRSLHAREKLQTWEDQVLATIRQTGCCDLDILLDPAFRRFPQLSEDTTWFPGREALAEERASPKDLKVALEDCDRSAPWRNHYRTDPSAHPSHQVDRLHLKFSPMDQDQE